MAELFRMTLRLPADLHDALVDLARREERSLHGMIIRLLRQAVAREGGGDERADRCPHGRT